MDVNKIMNTYDVHVLGEGFRIIMYSPFQLQRKESISLDTALKNQLLSKRRLLLNEPRGHRGITGCVITPSEQADFGVMFLHHHDEVYFSYSGLFAALTALLETGILEASRSGEYAIETTQGVYNLYAEMNGNEVVNMQMNFLLGEVTGNTNDWERVQMDELRDYYVFKLPSSIPTISLQHLSQMKNWVKLVLPNFKGRRNFAGIILTEALGEEKFRSVSFEKDGFILRSPGIDSTIALLTSAREKEEKIAHIIHENLIGTRLTATMTDGVYSIRLRPILTGDHQFILQEDDPLREGFLLK
ncbi:proline racemase family protein [Virgibacillus proomii]|uniref:proline racemase family protein n=1 Tax=Virgibacillus proomii TaxID=84407 RepID=UPI001C10E889|nr:proline racemase family protein [Virgibacillus proomii]MBU5266749.1 proline racemase family protein [Virgibacillus proomii]